MVIFLEKTSILCKGKIKWETQATTRQRIAI